MIGSLSDQISKLKRQNNGLVEKNKQLIDQVERKKREVTAAKRSAQTPLGAPKRTGMASTTKENHPPAPPEIDIKPGATHLRQTQQRTGNIFESPVPMTNGNATPAAAAVTDSNLLEVARKYKARLTAAEEQLSQLKDENARLRQEPMIAAPLSVNKGNH